MMGLSFPDLVRNTHSNWELSYAQSGLYGSRQLVRRQPTTRPSLA